jgi:hypothetical protein
MPHRALAACAVALVLVATAAPHRVAAAPPPTYVPPVDAPVADPFRPPDEPYGAGNRGLEYATPAGTEVRAAAAGVVTFAGLVAGTRHVTVRHPDGLRTTYSFLDLVDVVVGQQIRQGDIVGTTVGHLHLGARLGDAYLDPARLFDAVPDRAHLVPFDEPPGPGPSGERSAIRQLVGGVGRLATRLAGRVVDQALEGSGATAAWLRAESGQLVRTAAHYLGRTSPGLAQLNLVLRGLEMWSRARASSHRPCTAAGEPVPPPAERRAAILVAGLGSTSDSAAIDDLDTAPLGYDVPDVVRFSYAGGRTPDPSDAFTSIEATAYDPGATQGDLPGAGNRLADLVEAVAARAPGTPVDVYAHSQGGVVTRLALIELERRHGAAWIEERLGLVATLGTPHGGADLATAAYAAGSTRAGSLALDGLAAALGLGLDDDAPAVGQLAETSDLVAALRASPLPAGVDVVSIAARGDLVVPVPRTAAPGAVQVVVPVSGVTAHDRLPGSPEAARELALALAGQPPGCRPFRSALVDQAVGEGISWAEDAAGALAWVAGLRHGAPLGG